MANGKTSFLNHTNPPVLFLAIFRAGILVHPQSSALRFLPMKPEQPLFFSRHMFYSHI